MSEQNKPVNFYETSNEDKAKNPSAYGITAGGVVFVKGSKDGKIYRDGKPFGGGGGEEPFPSDAEAAGITVGGLSSGDAIAGMTPKELLEAIVYPEYAPYFVDATATIVCKKNNVDVSKLQEVGSTTPSSTDYTLGGNRAYAYGSSKNIAYNAAASQSKAILTASGQAGTKVTNYGTKVTNAGYFAVRCTSSCAQGQDNVKSSKGKDTNKIGGSPSSRVLLKSASANTENISAVDSNGHYYVKATSKTADHIIQYRYKLYASTDQAGVLSAKTLSSATSFEWTLKAGNEGQLIAIPSSYTNVKIEEYNTTLNSYTDVTSDWTQTTNSTDYKDASNTAVAYNVFRRGKAAGVDTKFRVSFNVG